MEVEKQYSKRFYLEMSLLLGALGMFAPVGTDMYLAGLVTLGEDLQTDVSHAQMTLSIYFLGLALGQVLYGPLIDRFGRVWPLRAGIVLFLVSSFLICVADTIQSVLVLRLLQALGGCSGMVAGRAVVRDLFDYRQSSRVFAMLGVVQGVAPIVAPVAGTVLIAFWGWRSTFVFMGIFGLGCLLAATFGLSETLGKENRRSIHPVNILRDYFRVLTFRPFLIPALAGAFSGSFLFVYICASPYVFMTVHGVSSTAYTAIFAMNTVGGFFSAHLNNRLLHRFSPLQLLTRALLLCAVFCLLLFFCAQTDSLPLLMVPLWLALATIPAIFANSMALALKDCGERAGVASALLGLLQFGIASLAGFGISLWKDGSAVPMALCMFGAVATGLAILYFGMRRERECLSA